MKIITLNMEGDKHTDEVILLQNQETASVLCLQEIKKSTFDAFFGDLGLQGFFAPMTSYEGDESEGQQWGVAILSDLPCFLLGIDYYENFSADYPEMAATRNERPRAVLLTVSVRDRGSSFTIATTHFTWTTNGETSEEQRVNLASLLLLLDKYPSLVLTGDFNAPRGTEIHQRLSGRFQDILPNSIESTLDLILHRSGLKLVVDGIFVTEDVSAKGVHLVSGVSDHCAIVADVRI